MTDIILPRPGSAGPRRITPFKLCTITFLIFLALSALNWSICRTMSERQCDPLPGPFSSAFSNNFQTYSCGCNSPFHFAEACLTPAMLTTPLKRR